VFGPDSHGNGSRTLHPVFIVGCGRSGTTLLRLMLNRHPDLAIPGESHFIPELWATRRRFESGGVPNNERLVQRILSTQEVSWWGISQHAVFDQLPRHESSGFAGVVEAVFMAYAAGQGKQRWGDKTPIYVRSIPLIARMFPTARFVHLIRDGRDVALSYQSIPTGPTNIWEAACRWRRDVRAGRRAGRVLGTGRYLEVRYEALVAQPESQVRAICSFLSLSFDPIMLEPNPSDLEKIRPAWRFMHSRAGLPPTAGLRDWRREMALTDRLAFEAVAGETLSDFGYERHWRTIPLRYWVHAQRVVATLTLHDRVSHAKTELQHVLQPVG